MQKHLKSNFLMLFFISILSFNVNASWHPFIKKPVNNADSLVLSLQDNSKSYVSIAQFLNRINKERQNHGLSPFQNESTLVSYLRTAKVVTCESVYGNTPFLIERTDGKGNFDATYRSCKPNELILVDSQTNSAIVSLFCGNTIQNPVVDVPKISIIEEPPKPKKNCYSTMMQMPRGSYSNGFIGIPLGANSGAVSISSAGGATAVSSTLNRGGLSIYPQIGTNHVGTYQNSQCR